ncbi:hypothetical protein ACFSCV_01765 [Methylopila henanensis]|uniref:Helix-turn-helix domain-containing protein n=1 Tax=Methylopila henanensis TaxID=873516 RepID=A0ABW4K0V4_9HYPH
MLIFSFILDWHHDRYGDALASARHIADKLAERAGSSGRALSFSKVAATLRELVAWGYLSATAGGGRSASRYVPAWRLVCQPAVAANDNGVATPMQPESIAERALSDAVATACNGLATKSDFGVSDDHPADICVPPVGHAVVPPVGHANPVSVPPVGHKDPLTETRPRTGFTERGTEPELGTPSPASVGGVAASSAARADEDDFERLWRAYGVRRGRADARAAFAKLPAEHLEDIITAAAAWREAWAAQGDPTAPRFTLAKWLADERYEEDAPARFQKRQPKPREPKGGPRGAVTGEAVTVLSVEVPNPFAPEPETHVTFRRDDGSEFRHVIMSLTDEGRALERALANAAGTAYANQAVGRRVEIRAEGKGYTYGAAPGGAQAPLSDLQPVPVDELAPERPAPAPKRAPPAPRLTSPRIVDASLQIEDDGSKTVAITIARPDGKSQVEWLPVAGPDAARLARLCREVGISKLRDTDELIGLDISPEAARELAESGPKWTIEA